MGEPHTDGPSRISDLEDGLKLGRMFEALLSSDLASKLSRYETSMQRQLTMTLKVLQEMQKVRAAVNAAKFAKQTNANDDTEDDWVVYNGRKVKRLGPP